jgi:hypothetical protein
VTETTSVCSAALVMVNWSTIMPASGATPPEIAVTVSVLPTTSTDRLMPACCVALREPEVT